MRMLSTSCASAQRNPKPCPLLEVTDPGDAEPKIFAPSADLRTDLGRYRVYRNGVLVEERHDIKQLWADDLVAFLLGCSFSFEHALLDAGVPVRHIEQGIEHPRSTYLIAGASPLAGSPASSSSRCGLSRQPWYLWL